MVIMSIYRNEINTAVKEFKAEIKKLYGNRFKRVILYGSWARGEGGANADVDLMVILKGGVTPGREIDRMIDIITEINLKYNTLLSIYPIAEKEYAALNTPLLMNVRREGVPS
jgi:predicted nucleotidyltransferase